MTKGNDAIVGSTGFVGGNLVRQHDFSCLAHSTNVESSFEQRWDVAVYAGVPSAMFLANADPAADLNIIKQARENLRRIRADKKVLISTVAVYANTKNRNEWDNPDGEGLSAYGKNRLMLERWAREDDPNLLVVRLPALYGYGLKKNFIFDMSHLAPQLLSDGKFNELADKSKIVACSYSEPVGGYRRIRADADRPELERFFAGNAFNSLSFTDSRSIFQFYDLDDLWADIDKALSREIKLINLVTPPLSASEVFYEVCGERWENELDSPPLDYDIRSVWYPSSQEEGGYLYTKEEELFRIKRFLGAQGVCQ